jgi:hypothetical protein
MAVSKRLRFEILRRDNHACRYCGRGAPEAKLTVDHVLPVALGGSDDASNLVTACQDCNGGKSATPPDAALVDDVAADALRWARARALAAQELLDDLAERNEKRAAFHSLWTRWGLGNGPDAPRVPLPDDWEHSLDNFIASGLPLEVLADCVEKAMRADKVKPENTFRYMCGIAWKLIGQLNDTATQLLDDEESEGLFESMPRAELEQHVWRFDFVVERFLKEVPVWVHERAERAADHDWECAGQPDATRLTKLPDVLRHVGAVLKECKVEPYPVVVD